jgi:transposase
MDQVHIVRHKVLVEGRTQRAVARELGLSRVTVKKYLTQAAPTPYDSTGRRRPVWEKVGPRIDALLATSKDWTGGKQQLTATRLHELLIGEGHQVGPSLVKAAVAEWKRQRREVFVPLLYRPGDLAEVDFFEVLVDLEGTRRKAWLFLMRLMYSGRDFAWIYERQDQVSFLDGHVRAFAHFGGIPARLAYDNLKAAVVRILVGGERRLTALASHYLFEPCFCRPGEGHDKGGVESRGKAVRRQALTPIPSAPTLDAINHALLAQMDARLATGRDGVGETIGTRFGVEAPAFRPLPAAFVAEATTFVTVSSRALVRLEGAVYSVPCRWAGLDLGGARGRHDGHDRRTRRHTDSASAEAVWPAIDRLPPRSPGARQEAAGRAPGAAGAPPRSRRPVSGRVGALSRGASRSRGRPPLREGARPD